MDSFTQKLRLIYSKLFHDDMDKFTGEFIDSRKFEHNGQKSRKQFFLNRKTVLRRWLSKKISCTSDFQKSFKNYKISLYQFRGEALFTLDDFRRKNNLKEFEEKLDLYLQYKQEVYVNKEYKHIYIFCEEKEEVLLYSILKWEKNQEHKIIITLEQEEKIYKGTFSLEEGNNVFLTLRVDNITRYMLFHDSKDSSCVYIVGTSMGYLAKDNKVPRAEKVIFAKEKLDKDELLLQFILNETESISAIENRLNPNSSSTTSEHFFKYTSKFKKYHTFFSRLIRKKYHQNFYHRLAFREFYAFYRLFERFSKQESYFVMNFQRAFLEAIKTVESIKNISFQVVMELNDESLFFAVSDKEFKIKSRFLTLSTYGVDCTIIFVVDDDENLSVKYQNLLTEMAKESLTVRVVKKERVIHKVNSLDFFFIYIGDERDFVLADPIRDNKDVFKLFINEVTMDEYRIDYRKIIYESIVYERL
jgi:hypothetical protein